VSCEYGYSDCSNLDNKCHICIDAFYYLAAKAKPKGGLQKKINIDTKRQGSASEVKNHNQNKALLASATSSGTPNSGAGKVKGDEQIRGLIRIMEEVKTTVKKNLNKEPGKESFTIQREWMDKLEREAREANEEFAYLKFSFKEHDDKFYVLADQSMVMDMVETMVHDRYQVNVANAKADVAEKARRVLECENIKLSAEIALLKANLKLQELLEEK
jgi:hypothetical protein